jgi:hypothetical protein
MDIYGEAQMLTYLQTKKWDVGLDIQGKGSSFSKGQKIPLKRITL